MKIIVVSVGHATAVYVGDGDMLSARIGNEYTGVDACYCNPARYMGVETVEINITWS